MDINELMKSVYMKMQNRRGRLYRHGVEETKKFLSMFSEPKDDIQRSYFQYKCQKWETIGKIEFVIANIASLILFFPKYYFYRKKRILAKTRYDAVLTMNSLSNKLPKDFHGQFISQEFGSGSLTKEDTILIKSIIKKYPFSFFFIYKVMCRVAAYSEFLRRYSPDIVFSSAEYSFTSSILTYFCESHGAKHYNIMHGEKGYNPRDAFSRFTRFYIWDEYYKKIFLLLRADKTEYIVDRVMIPKIVPKVRNNHCTYYLQLHTKEQLLIIKNELEKSKMDYHVRPHPLYASGLELNVFGTDHIEAGSINIWDSIASAGIAISQDSTVLYQAYLAGVPIAIDDVSDPRLFLNLKERGYIMFHKPHLLLSELLRN